VEGVGRVSLNGGVGEEGVGIMVPLKFVEGVFGPSIIFGTSSYLR
jgi:hypothetical protein